MSMERELGRIADSLEKLVELKGGGTSVPKTQMSLEEFSKKETEEDAKKNEKEPNERDKIKTRLIELGINFTPKESTFNLRAKLNRAENDAKVEVKESSVFATEIKKEETRIPPTIEEVKEVLIPFAQKHGMTTAEKLILDLGKPNLSSLNSDELTKVYDKIKEKENEK